MFPVLLYAGVEETVNLTIWRHAENFLLHSSGRLVDFGHGVGCQRKHGRQAGCSAEVLDVTPTGEPTTSRGFFVGSSDVGYLPNRQPASPIVCHAGSGKLPRSAIDSAKATLWGVDVCSGVRQTSRQRRGGTAGSGADERGNPAAGSHAGDDSGRGSGASRQGLDSQEQSEHSQNWRVMT